jgi:hypothetical protein
LFLLLFSFRSGLAAGWGVSHLVHYKKQKPNNLWQTVWVEVVLRSKLGSVTMQYMIFICAGEASRALCI